MADVAALGTITLQVEILHLPFHHHFLDRLQQRFFVQRETKGHWREVMTLHTATSHMDSWPSSVIVTTWTLTFIPRLLCAIPGTQLGIDGAAVHVLGLKLLIGPQAVNGLLQGVQSPDCLADGFTDRGLWVRFQQARTASAATSMASRGG